MLLMFLDNYNIFIIHQINWLLHFHKLYKKSIRVNNTIFFKWHSQLRICQFSGTSCYKNVKTIEHTRHKIMQYTRHRTKRYFTIKIRVCNSDIKVCWKSYNAKHPTCTFCFSLTLTKLLLQKHFAFTTSSA